MSADINPFEDKAVADEWISIIETGKAGTTREKEIYPRLQPWLETLGQGTIVDIGCGQGMTSLQFAESRFHYIGVDPSAFLIERAKELYGSQGHEFLQGSAYKLPLTNASVEGAISIGVWFHIDDLELAAQELARVLKPGREAYIFTANPKLNRVWESFFASNGAYEKNGKELKGAVGTGDWRMAYNVLYLHEEKELINSFVGQGLKVMSRETFGHAKENGDEGLWIGIKLKKN